MVVGGKERTAYTHTFYTCVCKQMTPTCNTNLVELDVQTMHHTFPQDFCKAFVRLHRLVGFATKEIGDIVIVGVELQLNGQLT
jgi:hypothetical protein